MWVVYALLCAFSLATSDALAKRLLQSGDERWVAWMRLVLAVPFLLPFLFFTPVPRLDQAFWLATFAALPLEIAAILLYFRAIKISPLSLTIPFLALSPVFLLLIGYVGLGEVPGQRQGFGVLLIAAGAYLLNVHASKEGPLGPLKAVFREKGSLLMVAVALIFSITSTLGKLAVNHSGPLFFGPFYFIILSIIFAPFALLGRKSPIPRWDWRYLGLGAAY
ncbi:MAG: DMT family transporter, partial [Nitrospirota bacterium]|nr:DMT family transporter [Nitrospirota bacterium]